MTQDPLIGRRLGAYLVQKKLGEGGMASVYKAYHDRLRREVAVKVISAQIADQEAFQLRFEREAQLVASLEHRNIVTVYDFGEQQDLTYLVMQFVGGGTLRERLQAGHPLSPTLAAQYTLQMARALHHAHQRGIVHRDVKPQNMLVSSSDPHHLLLSDFGIAKLFDAVDETLPSVPSGTLPSNPALTSADQMIGTAEYMAPEQINRAAVDARTDVYALGIVLYQMLTGYTPFHSTTILGLLYQQVHTPPKPLREVNPAVPEILAQITTHALEKSPAARFQSAEEMAQALEQALNLSTHPLSTTTTTSQFGPQGTFPSGISTSSQYQSGPGSYATYPGNTQATASSTHQTPLPTTTNIPVGAGIAPPRPKKKNRLSGLQSILTTLLLGVLVLLGVRFLPTLLQAQTNSGSPAVQSTTNVDSFDETFQNNQLSWLVGTDPSGHLTTILENHKYTLKIDNANATFFPYPGKVNPLPATFTVTATLSQAQGASDRYHGITL